MIRLPLNIWGGGDRKRHGSKESLGWRTFQREQESVGRWIEDNCPPRIHYTIESRRGRMFLHPCKCMGVGNINWRRQKMQRRLGMEEN